MNPNRMPLQRAMIAGIALAFLALPAPSFVPASVAVHIGEPALAMYGGCDSGGGETVPDEDYEDDCEGTTTADCGVCCGTWPASSGLR